MKKTILILLTIILTFMITATLTYAENISDNTIEDMFKADIFDASENPATSANSEDFEASFPKDVLSKDIVHPEPKGDLSDKLSRINSIEDDEQKIKEWAKISSKENYVIINKKECLAIVYDKDGNEIKSFEIGVGREIGDDFNDTRGVLGKPKNTTPAGEYTLIPNVINKAAYGDLTLSLGEKANKLKSVKKVVALHKVPKFRQQERLKKFRDGNLANNRMSHGCINFLESDFKELRKYIHGGLKLYVLPEEADNNLMLTKNDDG